MATREQLYTALRNADKAGDAQAATALAAEIKKLDVPQAAQKPESSFLDKLWTATKGDVGAALEGVGQVADTLTSPTLVEAAARLTPAGGIVAPLARKGAEALNRSGVTGHAAESVANVIPETKGVNPVLRTGLNIAGSMAVPVPELRIGEAVPKSMLPAAGKAAAVTGKTIGDAAARQGVDLIPADAGGTTAKMLTSGAKASPISGAIVSKAAKASQQQLADAAGRVAAGQGKVVTTDVAGQSIRGAAENYSKQSAATLGRLYDRAFAEAGDTRIVPKQTIAKLDDRISRLQNDPSAPEGAADELIRFQENIANGVDVQGLRDARTRLSQGVYDGKLRSGFDSAMWKDVLGDLSTDIQQGLTAAGKSKAAAMFKVADEGWAARANHIDDVLQPLLGKGKGGEEIVKSLESMTRGSSGGNAKLSRLLANMTPDDAGDVRALLIDRIGKATPGAQNAAGDVFSPSTFLTNWNKMTPQAKASLFGDTALRNDMNDLAKLSEGMKSSKAFENFSNTSLATQSNIAGQMVLLAAHPVLGSLLVGGQVLSGKLLSSPGVARLLTRAAKVPEEQQASIMKAGLSQLAKRASPAVAAQFEALQRALNDNMAVAPAAARQEQEQQQAQ